MSRSLQDDKRMVDSELSGWCSISRTYIAMDMIREWQKWSSGSISMNTQSYKNSIFSQSLSCSSIWQRGECRYNEPSIFFSFFLWHMHSMFRHIRMQGSHSRRFNVSETLSKNMRKQGFLILKRKYGLISPPFVTNNIYKMYSIQFLAGARRDFAEIYTYIAADNPFYADEVLSRIEYSVQYLKQFPLIGTKICGDTRSIVEPKYRFKIVYTIQDHTIFIISVFKYRENWKTLE